MLREGNSDRRAPLSVKNYARKHPHRMGAWSAESKSHVAHMDADDFYGSERSALIEQAGSVKIELVGKDGAVTVLKEKTAVQAGELIDAAVMSKRALAAFVQAQIADAKQQGVLFSLHLKATMMKVSDPIMFGVVGEAFYRDVLDKHAATLKQVGFDANNGIGDLYARIASLPEAQRAPIEADLQALANKSDEDIDYSDIPPSSDEQWSNAERGKFYRPLKTQASVRIDADVMEWLKRPGKGYQTRLNAILREAMLRDQNKK